MKAILVHRPIVKLLWKLLFLLLFPFVIWLYCQVLGIPFAEIDNGTNYHKWVIFFIYLGCLASWLSINRSLSHHSTFRH